ncbi:MAG: hypothetical protein NZM06_09320 [Chloroherpetonaceae bacterium]|nr:hypothetical protein [Chloroherpetonaceae bacterium]MDW8437304.1 hypothetical protein [Chloroherpetonaceae bacterium]
MKEIQLRLTTKRAWRDNRFEIETRYAPSVYVAKVSLSFSTPLDDEERENVERALFGILEEKLKADFKRYLEDAEERNGFLESSVLTRLSDKLAREVERLAKRLNAEWQTAID